MTSKREQLRQLQQATSKRTTEKETQTKEDRVKQIQAMRERLDRHLVDRRRQMISKIDAAKHDMKRLAEQARSSQQQIEKGREAPAR